MYLYWLNLGARQIPRERIKSLEEIGEGAQSVVYKGVLDDRTIALKFLKKNRTKNYYLLLLKHPNLITFLLVYLNINFCLFSVQNVLLV